MVTWYRHINAWPKRRGKKARQELEKSRKNVGLEASSSAWRSHKNVCMGATPETMKSKVKRKRKLSSPFHLLFSVCKQTGERLSVYSLCEWHYHFPEEKLATFYRFSVNWANKNIQYLKSSIVMILVRVSLSKNVYSNFNFFCTQFFKLLPRSCSLLFPGDEGDNSWPHNTHHVIRCSDFVSAKIGRLHPIQITWWAKRGLLTCVLPNIHSHCRWHERAPQGGHFILCTQTVQTSLITQSPLSHNTLISIVVYQCRLRVRLQYCPVLHTLQEIILYIPSCGLLLYYSSMTQIKRHTDRCTPSGKTNR